MLLSSLPLISPQSQEILSINFIVLIRSKLVTMKTNLMVHLPVNYARYFFYYHIGCTIYLIKFAHPYFLIFFFGLLLKIFCKKLSLN